MPISEFVLGAIISLGGVLLAIMAGVIGWLGRNLFKIKSDVDSLKLSYKGDEAESGHLQETHKEFSQINDRLDDLQDLIAAYERRRQEGEERLCGKIDSIIEVLREEDINGDLPSPQDDD